MTLFKKTIIGSCAAALTAATLVTKEALEYQNCRNQQLNGFIASTAQSLKSSNDPEARKVGNELIAQILQPQNEGMRRNQSGLMEEFQRPNTNDPVAIAVALDAHIREQCGTLPWRLNR